MPATGPPRLLRKIKFMAGDWDVVMSVKPDPQGDWVETKGKSTFRFILEDSVLEQDYVGEMWGRPFLGKGYFCFNRFSGKWQHTWSDNGAANISVFDGDFIEGRLVVVGEEKTPDGGFQSRATTYNISENKFDWMLEMSRDGDVWRTVMKAIYSRKSA